MDNTYYLFDGNKTSSGHGCNRPVDLIAAIVIQAPGCEANPPY